MAGSGSHNVNAMLGYRYSLFDNVTLISEIAVASNYAFASQAMPEATLTPQLQLVTDLGLAPGTPWKTTLDVKMNRERQLGGGDVRGGGSAMLRGLARSSGFAVVPEGATAAGGLVEWLPLP